jgi:hypothetical protein
MNTIELSQEQIISIKKSYLNIIALFLEKETVQSSYLRCLLKWGVQLQFSPSDFRHINVDVSDLGYKDPLGKVETLESIYHLTYMIYLDQVVEDVELEVASLYAVKLGFKGNLVSELFKSIATAAYDDNTQRDVRQEVLDFLKVYES